MTSQECLPKIRFSKNAEYNAHSSVHERRNGGRSTYYGVDALLKKDVAYGTKQQICNIEEGHSVNSLRQKGKFLWSDALWEVSRQSGSKYEEVGKEVRTSVPQNWRTIMEDSQNAS